MKEALFKEWGEKHFLHILILYSILFVLYFRVIIEPGVLRYGHDSWLMISSFFFHFKYGWFTLWNNYTQIGFMDFRDAITPQVFLFEFFRLLSPNAGIMYRLYIFTLSFSGIIGMYIFSFKINKSLIASFTSSLLFIFNPIFLAIILDASQTEYLPSYMAFPWILLFWKKTFEDDSPAYKLLASILTSTFIVTCPLSVAPYVQYIYGFFLLGFLIFNLGTSSHKKKDLKNVLTTSFLIAVLSWPIINFLRFFPDTFRAFQLNFLGARPEIEYISQRSFDSLLSATLLNIPSLFSASYPRWTVGPIFLIVSFIIIIFSFLGIIFSKKRINLFFGIMAVIAIWISKGSNPPFQILFNSLHGNLPLFDIMISFYRWGFITTFCYAILIGSFSKVVFNYVRVDVIFRNHFFRKILVSVFIYLIFSSAIVCYGHPNLSTSPARMYNPLPVFTKPFLWIKENEPEDFSFKILPVPFWSARYSWNESYIPFKVSYNIAEFSLLSPIFTDIGVIHSRGGTPESNPYTVIYHKYLTNAVLKQRSFEIANVAAQVESAKYIIVQTQSDSALARHKDFISKQFGVKPVHMDDGILIFENKNFKPIFTIASRPVLVIGGLDSLISLYGEREFNSTNIAPFFLNQMTAEEFDFILNSEPLVLFHNSDHLDYIFHADPDDSQRLSSIQLKEYNNWNGNLFASSSGDLINSVGTIRSEENGSLLIPINIEREGEYLFFIKAKMPIKGSVLSIHSNNLELGKIYSKGRDIFEWRSSGPIELTRGEKKIVLKTNSTIEIDAAMIMGEKIYYKKLNNFYEHLRKVDEIVYFWDVEAITPPIQNRTLIINDPYSNGGQTVRVLDNNHSLYISFSSPKTDICHLQLKAKGSGKIAVTIDGEKYENISINNSINDWNSPIPLKLDEGYHKIEFSVSSSKIYFDSFVMIFGSNKSVDSIFRQKQYARINKIDRESPSLYHLEINANEPFFLIFHESFHKGWRASASQDSINSIIASFFLNSFYINKTGITLLRVEFLSGKEIIKSWITSMAFYVGIAFFMILNYLRKKGFIKHILKYH